MSQSTPIGLACSESPNLPTLVGHHLVDHRTLIGTVTPEIDAEGPTETHIVPRFGWP